LVPNPSFDIQTACPDVSEIELALPWTAPTNGTPDLFQSGCPTQNVPGHTGPGSAGVYVHGEGAFANYREYVQAPLTTPLVAGQGYCVSVWVRRSNFRYATDRFGVLLSNTAISLANTNVLNFTPQVENTPGNILDNTDWEEISGGFTAQGGEQYITIGSFSGPANTTVVVANESNTSTVAFYRIDDVSVTACAVGMNEHTIGAFDVFPQPATDHLTVRLADGDALQNAELFDSRGGLVRAFAENGTSGLIHLDVSGIPNGLYHMIIRTSTGAATRTIILE
jgi:hypothetical protein